MKNVLKREARDTSKVLRTQGHASSRVGFCGRWKGAGVCGYSVWVLLCVDNVIHLVIKKGGRKIPEIVPNTFLYGVLVVEHHGH